MGTNTKYTNPIIPGFAPDPSVVLVDGIFYLCTSSFHVFPGLPIYASKDLKKWTHIGNALNRHSQLSLRDAITIVTPLDTGFFQTASLGIIAPTIRYNDGTFYIVTTRTKVESGVHKTDNFIIRTTDIWSNHWSDPVFFEFDGIDTSLFFDNDGRVYFQGSWFTGQTKQPTALVKQAEIDINTGRLLSETKEIWPGWARYDTEGPHMYKVGEYYYLMAAEGGTFENHMLSIGRSRGIWGPFETWNGNPIMTAKTKPEERIQNIGHGEMFQDGNGRWWAAVLGVRQQTAQGTLGLGRESFLSRVDWSDGGWPTVRQPRLAFEAEVVESGVEAVEGSNSNDPFQAPPHVEDLYIRDHDATSYAYSCSADGAEMLSLRPGRAGLVSPVESATFLGRRQRFLSGMACARLILTPAVKDKGVSAGMTVYKDPLRFASVAYNFVTSNIDFQVHNGVAGVDTIAHKQHIAGQDIGELDFRIMATPQDYKFEAKDAKSASWVEVGRMETKVLDGRDFTGPLLGVVAEASSEEGTQAWIQFQNYELVSGDPALCSCSVE